MLVSIGYELVFCFSPCVSDPFLPTIKLVAWVETFFFFKGCTRSYSSKNQAFCFQRYWTPNAAKYPCNNARKNFSRLDSPGWLAASRRVLWIRNAGQKPRGRALWMVLGRHHGWPREGAHTQSRIWRPRVSWGYPRHNDPQDRRQNLIHTRAPTSNTSTLKLSFTHSLSKWLYRSVSLRHLFFPAFYLLPKKMIGETFCPTHVSSGQDRQVWYISV